ncbi:hypothetical protein ACFWPA_04885 [Rhodococcus sp. NPDC058505]|uniref:AMIN-like domain-containing (lipo)protein n=1 Tax=Rhodococcus sp. NPDC058505 TaxID=3346531 RepID=UPI003648AF35
MTDRFSRSRTMTTAGTSIVAMVSLAGALASCATSAEPAATAASAVTSTSAAAPSTPVQEYPPARGGVTEPRAAASGNASLSVTDVRVGSHDGYDRVVYELHGEGEPGWNVRYVDAAVQDGSGREVDVAGRQILEVSLTGTGYPFDTGVDEYAGPNPLPGAGAVSEVRVATVFEGVTQTFIGLDTDQLPVTVSRLSNPERVVVDFAR